jgi:hypothetical protein
MTSSNEPTSGLLAVRVEVWPVSADELGIWLVSSEADAWRSAPIPADSEPHVAVQNLLREHGELDAAVLLHSTSWRVDQDAVVLSYIAVLGSHGYARHPNIGGHGDYQYVLDVWPAAKPLTLNLARAVGKPRYHGPIDPPAPRYLDVLMHGVRHLRFLLETDVNAQAALDDHWRYHLSELKPTLAGMYQRQL